MSPDVPGARMKINSKTQIRLSQLTTVSGKLQIVNVARPSMLVYLRILL